MHLRRYGVYTYEGSDEPWTVNSGRLQNNRFKRNTIVGGEVSMKVTDADGTKFNGNAFEEVVKIRFENSTMTVVKKNSGLDAVELTAKDGSCFSSYSDAAFVPIC